MMMAILVLSGMVCAAMGVWIVIPSFSMEFRQWSASWLIGAKRSLGGWFRRLFGPPYFFEPDAPVGMR